MLGKLSLRAKLLIPIVVVTLILGGVSIYEVNSLRQFDTVLARILDVNFTQLTILDDIHLNSDALVRQTFEYQHETEEGVETTKGATQIATSVDTLKRNVDNYLTSTAAQAETPALRTQRQTLQTLSQHIIQTATSLVSAVKTRASSTESIEEELSNSIETFNKTVDSIVDTKQAAVTTDGSTLDDTAGSLVDIILVLAASVIGVIVALNWIVAVWLSRSLLRIKKGAELIANGNLSELLTIRSKDEIGQLGTAFNAMASRLKDSYRRLAIERQRDEAILHSMGEGMIAIDEQQRVVLINEVAADLLELPDTASSIGKPIGDIYHLYAQGSKNTNDKEIPIEERPSVKALQTGQPVKDVFLFKRADGKKYLLDVSANPIKLAEQTVGAVIILRDVTKEKEIDRMKTEFISLASHQLRTPLSAIKWFSEMLASGDAGELKPEQLDFVHNIADSTERMISLVNALLNISRIESGRIMVDPKPTDLKELVTGIVNDLKAKTEEKKQSLIISVHDDLPKISLDPRLIGQVYLNLLTNAIKYTPKSGEISVFISKKDDQVISQVTDNGYGIPTIQQDRIFQKFFRASNAVKVETDGTGLGLYLIKAIIESSGGKIWFESDEGKGTTFWFSIPLTGMKPKEGEVTLDA